MGGDSRPNPAVYITLREIYDLLCDTREKLVVIANDIRWVKDVSEGYGDQVTTLQSDIKAIWDDIADIKSTMNGIRVEQRGMWATIRTAASIGSLLVSVAVAIYVGTR
ncbi:MAG: hypothetical protein WCQ69_07800 [Bacteroidales bacterium]|jgi:hypothetical protein